jgi:LysM repeat protein
VTAPPISLLPESLPARSLPPSETTKTTQVVSYEEVRHVVRAGDTFQSLSKEYYNNEGYAPALKLWNQNHPRASDAMAHDGTPVPGERLFIPPVAQLEQHYGASIPNVKAAPKPAGTMQTSYTAPAAVAAPELTYYRVIRDESLEAIAGSTLGSRDRANDVQRLNPLVAKSGQVVPAGTLLALPAAARVPPENVPR